MHGPIGRTAGGNIRQPLDRGATPAAPPPGDRRERVRACQRAAGIPTEAAAGAAGNQVTDPLTTVVHRHGLEVVDPATVFRQLAVLLPLRDLVAVGDALILAPVSARTGRTAHGSR